MNVQRALTGFICGVLASLAMSVFMVVGVLTEAAPMPKPIPAAIVGKLLGGPLQEVLLPLAILSHLVYGGIWGALLVTLARPVTIWKGIGVGIALWLIMQIVVLPFLGWGAFGTAVTPAIAVATFILHLVYGFVLGWLAARAEGREGAPALWGRRYA